MASILGIKLDGDRATEARGAYWVHVGAHEERNPGDTYWLAWARVQEPWDYDLALTVRATGDTESEAIAALEAKVRRLPGVLAVLNGGGQ